jgi:hypothetical protein
MFDLVSQLDFLGEYKDAGLGVTAAGPMEALSEGPLTLPGTRSKSTPRLPEKAMPELL